MKSAFTSLLILLLAGCSSPEPRPRGRFGFTEAWMGTIIKIVLHAEDAEKASAAAKAAFAEIAAVDAAMSDFKPESELNLLSRSAGGEARPLSPALFDVLQASREYYTLSGGAFDVTVGPVVKLWRVARNEKRLPGDEELRRALDCVGTSMMILDPASRTARLEKAGMSLDLGGIAKGYACDRALQALARLGYPDAFVDAGGGMSLGDPPPGKPGWRVRVSREGPRTILASRRGVATSGDTHVFVDIGGRRYSHIVDPRTGLGLTNGVLATVVARDGMTADALATAICVLGPEKGLKLAEDQPDVEALLRWVEDGKPREAQTSGFQALVAPPLLAE